jgi:uncharacterized membrane protein YfcA
VWLETVHNIGLPSPLTLALLALAALVAGFVDAVVGGGGLITIPALLLGLPAGTAVTTILGTNKLVGCTGTTIAAAQFARARVLTRDDVLGPIAAGLLGGGCGAAVAYLLERRFEPYIRPVMLAVLVAILAFTLLRPEMGRVHAPRFGLRHQRGLALVISAVLGFYDGLFGPGTGSLLIFLFVSVLGFDFLRASALAKAVNWASNLSSLTLFVVNGSWIPVVAFSMAIGSGLGGFLGARTALRRGNRWVRVVFIVVVIALILRLGTQILPK